MTNDQLERLVSSWEGINKALGELNEAARQALSKQWPEPKQPRDAVVTRPPTAEDKLRKESGNTEIPIEDWLAELGNEEDDIGPRERAFIESESKKSKARPKSPRPKASPEASGSGSAST